MSLIMYVLIFCFYLLLDFTNFIDLTHVFFFYHFENLIKLFKIIPFFFCEMTSKILKANRHHTFWYTKEV